MGGAPRTVTPRPAEARVAKGEGSGRQNHGRVEQEDGKFHL